MAQQQTTGVVFHVHEKEWSNKILYSFKFDGQDDWYRMGENQHAGIIERGNKVAIKFSVDQRGNNQIDRVKLLEAGVGVSEQAPRQNSGGGGGQRRGGGGGGNAAKDTYWKDREARDMEKEARFEEKDRHQLEVVEPRITFTAARRDALDFVMLLATAEALELPAKTKKNERLAAIESLHDHYTAKFFADAMGTDTIARADAEVEVHTEVPAVPETAPNESPEGGEVDHFADDDAPAAGGDDDEVEW